jgi:hypothetical protein
MSDHETRLDAALQPWKVAGARGDWEDVLQRAGQEKQPRRHFGRPAFVVATAFISVLIAAPASGLVSSLAGLFERDRREARGSRAGSLCHSCCRKGRSSLPLSRGRADPIQACRNAAVAAPWRWYECAGGASRLFRRTVLVGASAMRSVLLQPLGRLRRDPGGSSRDLQRSRIGRGSHDYGKATRRPVTEAGEPMRRARILAACGAVAVLSMVVSACGSTVRQETSSEAARSDRLPRQSPAGGFYCGRPRTPVVVHGVREAKVSSMIRA